MKRPATKREPAAAREAASGIVAKTSKATQAALAKIGIHRDFDLVLHLPLRYEEDAVIVATTDPLETVALDDLRLLLGKPVRSVLTSGLALLACLNRVYDEAASPAGAAGSRR